MDDTTIIDSSIAKTPGVFSRTRSRDGTIVPPPVTNFMIEELMGKLKHDVHEAEELIRKNNTLVEEEKSADDSDPIEDSLYQLGYETDI